MMFPALCMGPGYNVQPAAIQPSATAQVRFGNGATRQDAITVATIENIAPEKQGRARELEAEMAAGLEAAGFKGVARFNRAKTELFDLMVDYPAEKPQPGQFPSLRIILPRQDYLAGKDLQGIDLEWTFILTGLPDLRPISLQGTNLKGMKAINTYIHEYFIDAKTKVSPEFRKVSYNHSTLNQPLEGEDAERLLALIARFTGERLINTGISPGGFVYLTPRKNKL